MGRLAVIAIGGNSLIKSNNAQKVEDQHDAIRETMQHVADLIEMGYQVIVSHGNGPQVGFIMRRSEIAHAAVGMHPVPMVNCVADTQGSIGYQIQQTLFNELESRGLPGGCITLVTQVMVDPADPGFLNPAKPVGSFFDDAQADEVRRNFPHWVLKEDAGRGWRRVVPSPRPIEIIELPVIRALMSGGFNLVAVGGGGIPVMRTPEGLMGVDAVIDKDLASSMLADELGADLMIISTAVERIALSYGKPNQTDIGHMTVAQARNYIAQGQFAPGSMLPKVEAALEFLQAPDREVIVTSPEYIKDAVIKNMGTHITV